MLIPGLPRVKPKFMSAQDIRRQVMHFATLAQCLADAIFSNRETRLS
jgi:hypothetical protein